MYKTALFSGKIYTADKNFTRPPVATVATNSKSGPTTFIALHSSAANAACLSILLCMTVDEAANYYLALGNNHSGQVVVGSFIGS